jgi:uncharacterized protein involved in exopolysaccharide biosynthesis
MAETTGRTKTSLFTSLDLRDILAMLTREVWVMAVVFLVVFAIGAVVALKMPSAYTANASLLMQLNKDYVYRPLAGDAANGAIATIDQVVESEVEILNSTELKRRVIAKVGYRVVLPKSPQYWDPRTGPQKQAADAAAIKVLQSGLEIATAPQNNVVRLTFKHADAQSASLILNTLIDEYQDYRTQVYGDTMGPELARQKASFDQQLIVADRAYQDFLAANGVGDFDAAKTTYAKIYDQVTADLYVARSLMAQDQAKYADVKGNLARLSPEMSVERDLDLSIPSRILALQSQRQELLAKYLPTAQPVKDLDGQIASLQALMSSGKGIGEKDHKMGSNPVYQDLLTQRLNLEADMASLQGRIQQGEAQADQVTHRMQSLLGVEAQYNNLAAERDALQKNIAAFTQRIQENQAQQQMTRGAADAVRVVEKASLPDKPKSLKKVVLILAFLFAVFTALCAGLLRVFTRRGFASAAMASRALDLPVLAQATMKAPADTGRAA